MRANAFLRIAMCQLAMTVWAHGVAAQDATPAPSGPCRETACKLLVDWGPGVSPASFAVDRRYGSPFEFEERLTSFLVGQGLKISLSGGATIYVRPRMGKAMCDAMPGTNTSYDCTAITDVMINLAPQDSTARPISLRLPNRCGGEGLQRTMKVFAEYVGENLDIAIDPNGKKRKAKSRC